MAKKWGLLQKFGKKSEKKVKFFSKMGKKSAASTIRVRRALKVHAFSLTESNLR
jgi:hypothetical protein